MGLLIGKFHEFLTELSACDMIMVGYCCFMFYFLLILPLINMLNMAFESSRAIAIITAVVVFYTLVHLYFVVEHHRYCYFALILHVFEKSLSFYLFFFLLLLHLLF